MRKNKKRQVILKHIVIFIVVITAIVLLNVFKIGCPIRYFLGVPCPTCGLTRSVISLLRLNFRQSLYYHPLTLLIIPTVIVAIHRDYLPRSFQKPLDYVIIAVALIVFVVYLIRFSKIP